jgi:hypothetical protein
MSEHMPKEPLPKSTRKVQPSTDAASSTAQGPTDDVIRLQRLVGNHAVQRMLIQTKMTVGAADDPYEREADSVASQVMAQRDTSIQRSEGAEDEGEELAMKRVDIVQRADEGGEMEDEELAMKRVDIVQRADEGGEMEDEEIAMKRVDIQRSESAEDEGEELQMKRAHIQRQGSTPINDDEALEQEADEMGAQAMRKNDKQVDMSGSFDVDQDIESKISAKSGSGQTIPDVNRDMFESSMGHDFSGVNIHADSESDSLNKQVGARAFTTGSDIFFRQGEYNPSSSKGQELLAHELTHVVQQGGAKVQKKSEED